MAWAALAEARAPLSVRRSSGAGRSNEWRHHQHDRSVPRPRLPSRHLPCRVNRPLPTIQLRVNAAGLVLASVGTLIQRGMPHGRVSAGMPQPGRLVCHGSGFGSLAAL